MKSATAQTSNDGPVNGVLIAGGTGGDVGIRSLAPFSENLRLSYLAGTWDSGGGSGRLLAAGHIELPPGDVAQGLLAMSSESKATKSNYRHRDEHGQSLVNLHLVAYQQQYGSFKAGVEAFAQHLKCEGSVYTVTEEQTRLQAVTKDGQLLVGEHNVDEYAGPIKKLELFPAKGSCFSANQDAVAAIMAADVILLGPGSLYTSIWPNFLIKEIQEAVERSRAPIIGIANLANDAHTVGWTAHDYGHRYCRLAGRQISHLVVNNGKAPAWLEENYLREGQDIVKIGRRNPKDHYISVKRDLISRQDLRPVSNAGGVKRSLLRHPPHHLGAILLDIFCDLGFNRPW